jgi:hypothetical protein
LPVSGTLSFPIAFQGFPARLSHRRLSKPLQPIRDLPKGGRRCDDRSPKGRPKHGTHFVVRRAGSNRKNRQQVLGRSDRLRTAGSRLAFVPLKKENSSD